MIIPNLIAAATVTMSLTSVQAAPQTNQAPAPAAARPQCTTDVTVIRFDTATVPCNLTPPQTLVMILEDASDSNMFFCDDMGGQVLIDAHVNQVLCLGIDY